MSAQEAIDILVDALTAVPAYDNPLNPVYATLNQQRPLTLQVIRQHSELLHDHADQAQDQTFAVHRVIQSCETIPPTPLPLLPLGF